MRGDLFFHFLITPVGQIFLLFLRVKIDYIYNIFSLDTQANNGLCLAS